MRLYSSLTRFRTQHKAVSVMFLFNGTLLGAWASRIPSIKNEFNLQSSELGCVLLILALGAIISFPIAGKIADRFGSKTTTIAYAIGYLPTLVMIGISPNIYILVMAVFFFGVGHGGLDVAMNSWGAQVEKENGKSTMSFFHAMFSLGAGIGAIFGALSAWVNLSYSEFFCIFAFFILPLILFSNIEIKELQSIISNQQSSFQFPTGNLLIIALVAFSCAIGEGAMIDWSAVYISTVLHYTDGEAALGYAIFSVAMVLTRLMGDRIINQIGAFETVKYCGLSAIIGSTIFTTANNLPLVFIGLVFLGIGYSIVMPLVYSKAANTVNLNPGVAIASVASFGYGGMLIGPPLIGFIAEKTSLRLSFLLLIVLSFVIFFGAKYFNTPSLRITATVNT